MYKMNRNLQIKKPMKKNMQSKTPKTWSFEGQKDENKRDKQL